MRMMIVIIVSIMRIMVVIIGNNDDDMQVNSVICILIDMIIIEEMHGLIIDMVCNGDN